MRWLFGLFFASLSFAAVQAQGESATTGGQAPPADIWHHVKAGSPFFSEDTARMRIAAILQSDGNFARVILGANDLGAYVTVALPGDAPASGLKSELAYTNGARVTRTIPDTSLDTLPMPGARMTIYSFAIAAEDILAFQKASRWYLTPEDAETVTITLDGSSAAITEALEARSQVAETEGDSSDLPLLTGLPQPAE